jgi:hypothetical protein
MVTPSLTNIIMQVVAGITVRTVRRTLGRLGRLGVLGIVPVGSVVGKKDKELEIRAKPSLPRP